MRALEMDVSQEILFFPHSFEHISEVMQLDLSFSDLASLPAQIGSFVGLVTLNLSHNKLETIPESIANLTSLARLNLQGNTLVSIPPFIRESGKLELIM